MFYAKKKKSVLSYLQLKRYTIFCVYCSSELKHYPSIE